MKGQLQSDWITGLNAIRGSMPNKFFLLIGFVMSSASLLIAEEKMDLYLLIGQSNMAGRAPIEKKDEGVIERCFLLNGEDKFEPAKNPLNRYSTIRKGLNMQKMNPGYSFSKAMLKEDSRMTIGLVVNAKGGSSIKQWTRDAKFYQEALQRMKAAMEKGELKGVLWHQGETDHKDPEYLDKLKELVENLRKDLELPKLPFVAGQVNNAKEVNDQIAKLSSEVPHTGVVKSEGLTAMDRWHFDTKSMKILGERYAAEMLKIQRGQ
jgi:hypothetical protein